MMRCSLISSPMKKSRRLLDFVVKVDAARCWVTDEAMEGLEDCGFGSPAAVDEALQYSTNFMCDKLHFTVLK